MDQLTANDEAAAYDRLHDFRCCSCPCNVVVRNNVCSLFQGYNKLRRILSPL